MHIAYLLPWGARDGSAAVSGCRNGMLFLWRLGADPSSKPERLQTRILGGISALACSPLSVHEVRMPGLNMDLTQFWARHWLMGVEAQHSRVTIYHFYVRIAR